MFEGWTADILGYKQIQINGVALPSRYILNLIGGLGQDNPQYQRTDVSVGGGGGGGGASVNWHTGSGAPGAGLGVDGDFYLNTSSGALYRKITGTWILLTNLTGPTGATGSTGPAGPQGPAGQDGGTGGAGTTWRAATGSPSNGLGVNGDWYINLSNGATYQKINNGYQFQLNLTGPAGAQGPQGAPGSQGLPGPQGIQGPAGATGATGATGPAGATGPTGPTGPAGTPGSVWRAASGVPANTLGAVGDFYLNTANSSFYEKVAGSPANYVLRGALTAATSAINVSFSPVGGVSATNVQDAIAELGAEKGNLGGGNIWNGTQNFSGGALFAGSLEIAGQIRAFGSVATGATAPPPGVELYTHGDLGVQGTAEIVGVANSVSASVTNGHLRVVAGRLYTGVTAPPANGDIRASGNIYSDQSLFVTAVVKGNSYQFANAQTIERMVDLNCAYTNNASLWQNQGGAWQTIPPDIGQPLFLGLNAHLAHAATLLQVRVRVKPSSGRSAGLRMSATLFRRARTSTTPETLVSITQDDGTTATQDILLTMSHTIDIDEYIYTLMIAAGNGGSGADFLHAVDVRYSTIYMNL